MRDKLNKVSPFPPEFGFFIIVYKNCALLINHFLYNSGLQLLQEAYLRSNSDALVSCYFLYGKSIHKLFISL
jgi:hypothetical protein